MEIQVSKKKGAYIYIGHNCGGVLELCCIIFTKLLAYPIGLCLFLKAIVPYAAEKHLVLFRRCYSREPKKYTIQWITTA